MADGKAVRRSQGWPEIGDGQFLSDGRQQQGRQNGDDGDHREDFNQGKGCLLIRGFHFWLDGF
jgi:hypothetical protein